MILRPVTQTLSVILENYFIQIVTTTRVSIVTIALVSANTKEREKERAREKEKAHTTTTERAKGPRVATIILSVLSKTP